MGKLVWRGRGEDQPQIGNANQDFLDLTPASEAPAELTRSNWAATLPDTDLVPLIWEERYNDRANEEQQGSDAIGDRRGVL